MARGLLDNRSELEALFDELKLYRADPQDREDLVSLWPLCQFASPAEALDAFTNAYPHAPHDEYLGDYITDVVRGALSE